MTDLHRLETLARQWRERATRHGRQGWVASATAYTQAATELEAAIGVADPADRDYRERQAGAEVEDRRDGEAA